MTPEIEDFLYRLGKVNHAVNANGQSVLKHVVRVCMEMLSDRGCTVVRQSSNILKDIVAGRRVVWGEHETQSTDIFMSLEDKVGVKFARNSLSTSVAHCIVLVSIDGPTPFTRKECDGRNIQFMNFNRLQTNVVKHDLVPRHEKIPCSEYDPEALPKMFDTDPIAQYYNWPAGSIIRITRVSGGSEPVPYFRVVVPA